MAFPSSPANNDYHLEGDILWQYSNGLWVRPGPYVYINVNQVNQVSEEANAGIDITLARRKISPNKPVLVSLSIDYDNAVIINGRYLALVFTQQFTGGGSTTEYFTRLVEIQNGNVPANYVYSAVFALNPGANFSGGRFNYYYSLNQDQPGNWIPFKAKTAIYLPEI